MVLHGAPHKGDDAHFVVLALSVLQRQLCRRKTGRRQPEAPRAVPSLCFALVSMSFQPTTTLTHCLTLSSALPLAVGEEGGLPLHSRGLPSQSSPTLGFTPPLPFHSFLSALSLLWLCF